MLTRTTRSVAPTEAGEKLVASIGPHMEEIEAGLAALSELRDKPAGTIRLTTVDHAAETILWPALANFLAKYSDIHIDLIVDNTLRDIVSERFDAGIRMGERVARDMIAVRIGPEIQMAAVATPDYFAKHGKPKTPQDLAHHKCINMRFATLGNVYAWEFEKGSREVNVKVEGQLTVNDIAVIREAALNGVGIGFMPEDIARPHVDAGRLVPCWLIGHHLSPATIFITPAAVSNHPHLPSWWRRCATGSTSEAAIFGRQQTVRQWQFRPIPATPLL